MAYTSTSTLADQARSVEGQPGGPVTVTLVDGNGVMVDERTFDSSSLASDLAGFTSDFVLAMAAEGQACSVIVGATGSSGQ